MALPRSLPINAAPPTDGTRQRGRPRLSDADVAARRERVIDAAYALFIEHGFAETTLEAIGRAAGVTKRTIYELIGDKRTVFEAASSGRALNSRLFTFDIRIEDRPLRCVLRDAARRLVEHSFNPEVIAIQRTMVAECIQSSELVSDILVRGKEQMTRTIGRFLDSLIESGAIGSIDTLHASEVFFDAIIGARGFRAALGHPEGPPDEAEIDVRVTMFLHGYLEHAKLEVIAAQTPKPR
jgi:TetR/AcrR family transcriptional repressor of mexJK operon